QIYDSGSSGVTTVADSVTYYECTIDASALTANPYLFDSPATGRLRYTGTNPVMMKVACSATVTTSAGTSMDLDFVLGKNGTADASSLIQYTHLLAASKVSVTVFLLVSVVQNDYVSLMVKNTTDTNNVVVTNISLQATGIII
ncbi:unnamed protein product, partial [marine sediment metagenome]